MAHTNRSGACTEVTIGATAVTDVAAGRGPKRSAGTATVRRTMEKPIVESRPTHLTGTCASVDVEAVSSAPRGMGVVVTARLSDRTIAATVLTCPGMAMVRSTVRAAAVLATLGRCDQATASWLSMSALIGLTPRSLARPAPPTTSAITISVARTAATRERNCLRVAASESKLGSSLGCIQERSAGGGGTPWRRHGNHADVRATQLMEFQAS